MSTSGYFNTLVSSISADEHPLLLVTFDHADLEEPFRIVNNTEDITSNGETYYAAGFKLNLPSQPAEGLPAASISMPYTVDVADFIESSKGQGTSCNIKVVLPSHPDDIEYEIDLQAKSFSVRKDTISAKLTAPNYYQIPAFPVIYGRKWSPGLV